MFAFHTNDDATTDSLKTYDISVSSIATPTISSATDVFTNQAESAQVSVFVDQNTDDVYVAYCKGGTWQAAVDVVYHKSSDGMTNWSVENAYSEATADDFRTAHAGRTASSNGGRYMPSFFNSDLFSVSVNLVNDVDIPAAAAAASSFRNELLSPILFDLPFGNLAPVPSSVFGQEQMISFARKYSQITLSTAVVVAVNRFLTLLGVGQ
jgi:hypothetical protein